MPVGFIFGYGTIQELQLKRCVGTPLCDMQVLGGLSFFFNMPHINTARTDAGSSASFLTVQSENFKRLLVNFVEDENIIAENCLIEFQVS